MIDQYSKLMLIKQSNVLIGMIYWDVTNNLDQSCQELPLRKHPEQCDGEFLLCKNPSCKYIGDVWFANAPLWPCGCGFYDQYGGREKLMTFKLRINEQNWVSVTMNIAPSTLSYFVQGSSMSSVNRSLTILVTNHYQTWLTSSVRRPRSLTCVAHICVDPHLHRHNKLPAATCTSDYQPRGCPQMAWTSVVSLQHHCVGIQYQLWQHQRSSRWAGRVKLDAKAHQSGNLCRRTR